MKKALSLLVLLSTQAWANLHLAPPDFETSEGRAIFVDFKTAQYDLDYDVPNQKVTAKSRIVFHAQHTGRPLFDLIPSGRKMKLDGTTVKDNDIKFPGKYSTARILNRVIAPGEHVLEIENEITRNVTFDKNGKYATSAFWIRDLKDRMFLEQYVPSNFEFDQYQMNVSVNILGVKKVTQDIYTNGKLTKVSPSKWTIEFPDYFTVSCPFFHMTNKGSMSRLDFTHKSVDGRDVPITVYSPSKGRTNSFKPEALRVLKELERDYGPWAHPSLVAYGTFMGTGGMEHSGATATSFQALDHEMLHSYFAKGVMPANGNAGWIDEAIASWRDRGYQRLVLPGFGGSDLGLGSIYKRNTDDRAYKLGAAFMGYLDYRLQNVGGLKAFLRGYFQTYKHMVITQEHFKNNMEFFSGLDLSSDFETFVWGVNSTDEENFHGKNPHHPEMTDALLKSLL